MIRFSCPGCGATYTVGDEKGGKTGKCPKCQSQFQIPAAEGAGAAAPTPSAPQLPSPSADPNAAVEIAPCPGCQARLSVTNADLGADVECPYCKRVYKAVAGNAAPAGGSKSSKALADDDRPSRRRRDEDEEDERPSRRKPRRDEEEEEERPSRRRREEAAEEEEEERPSRRRRDDDEEEDRPRKKKRRRGGNYEPHRGVIILVLGILSWVFCGIFTAIPAWIMGSADLKKMDAGEMDPEGRQLTQIGKILGMISVILTCVMLLGYCVIFLILGIGGAAAGGR